MSFLEKNDVFLILDYPDCCAADVTTIGGHSDDGMVFRALSQDDLCRIREVGPKTVFFPVFWSLIESSRGVYDWSVLDAQVEKCRKADMKLLLTDYTIGPRWCPETWYVKSMPPHKWDKRHGSLSLWNVEAQEYVENFIRMMGRRYVGSSVNILCTQAAWGEGYFDDEKTDCFFDEEAIKSFRKFSGNPNALPFNATKWSYPPLTSEWLRNSIVDAMLRRNKLLIELNGNNEVWSMAQHCWRGLGGLPGVDPGGGGSGTQYIRDVLMAYKTQIPNVQINGIQYTCFNQPEKIYMDAMMEDKKNYDMTLFVGAEFCKGLPINTPKVIRLGIQGFILAPLSRYDTPRTTMESWMFDNIRKSHLLLVQRRMCR